MRLLKVLIAIALCLSLSVVVYAHSGRTDSQGGHMNHSTGEYHYHHGFSAHQHYDKDGDGILDCPYDFNDKTGSSSSSGKPSSKTPSKSTVKAESSTPKPANSKKNSNLYEIWEFLMILVYIFGFLAVPVVVSWFLLLVMRLLKWLFRF